MRRKCNIKIPKEIKSDKKRDKILEKETDLQI